MTSLFDTLVRERRNHTQWAHINAFQFMKEMALNSPHDANKWEHEAILKVHYRPDVSSRYWWTIEWTGEDGQRYSTDSQELDLCLWRAAQIETRTQETQRKSNDGQCVQCKSRPRIQDYRFPNAVYCNECFLENITAMMDEADSNAPTTEETK